jgi:Ca2+-binding RTX toxin-like protein
VALTAADFIVTNYLAGTTGNDLIDGRGGNDTLWGKAGNDVLTGGSGRDTFVFDTKLNAKTNVDRIVDFNVADDTIRLENAVFTKLTKTGALSSSNFVTGSAAKDSNDYIVYNKSTGALSYDADGSGSGAAVRFAVIANKVALTAADFIVI